MLYLHLLIIIICTHRKKRALVYSAGWTHRIEKNHLHTVLWQERTIPQRGRSHWTRDSHYIGATCMHVRLFKRITKGFTTVYRIQYVVYVYMYITWLCRPSQLSLILVEAHATAAKTCFWCSLSSSCSNDKWLIVERSTNLMNPFCHCYIRELLTENIRDNSVSYLSTHRCHNTRARMFSALAQELPLLLCKNVMKQTYPEGEVQGVWATRFEWHQAK